MSVDKAVLYRPFSDRAKGLAQGFGMTLKDAGRAEGRKAPIGRGHAVT